MSIFFTSRPYTRESKRQAISELLTNAVPDRDFFILVISAIILAACGILIDSIPVLIASMIVAPLAYPILSLALAITARDGKLLLRSAVMLILSMILAIVIGGGFSLFAKSYFPVAERVFILFFPNVFFDLLIAVLSGAVAAYGLMRTRVGAAMTGIGIAVSLMPPLVATGIGVFDPVNDLALRAGSIFLFNLLGILVGSMFVFLLFGIHREHKTIKNNVK